jgi:Lysyl oxidase
MRGPALLIVAAYVAGCGAGAPAPQLPDLDQAVPAAVTIHRQGDRVLLAFASAVDNVGPGPLVVHAERASGAETMSVRQVLGDETVPVEGELRYVRAQTHAHWHLMGFERYELRDASGRRVVTARKAGFCLGDRYDSHRSRRIPGEPAEPVWTEECGRHEPGLRKLDEGISPGYGDDYAPVLEGQYVDVTGLAGEFVLVHLANPDRILREASYANNAAAVAIRLDGRGGLEILARCPDSAECPEP